jgi:hypothetical protein
MVNKWRPEINCPVTNPTAKDVFWMGADFCLDALLLQDDSEYNEFSNGTWVFIPDDPPEEVEVVVSGVMCDNCLKLNDDYYRKVNDNHPAAIIVERGHFCEKCGMKITVPHFSTNCATHNRGIRH